MALPVIKLLLATVRLLSRPVNNHLKKFFTHRFVFMSHFFEACGGKAHEYEVKMNRFLSGAQKDLDFYIKPLSKEASFNKGVEYFVEVVFFYGLLVVIMLYEMSKAAESADKQKKELVGLKEASIDLDTKYV